MDSFYGGKQGISFVIKERFTSIDKMDEKFENPAYNTVWYGEYCIIDTMNKNDKDNGKVFRRTGNHTINEGSQDTRYAEYIGQIIGPAGGIPNVELESSETLDNKFKNLNNGLVYYYGTKNNGSEGYIQDNAGASNQALIQKSVKTNVDYVSGKTYYYDRNDEKPALKYKFYTFQSNDKDAASGAFPIATVGIAFEIPYVDFDITNVEGVTPDQGFSITSNERNKFYREYTIKAPMNIPGPALKNIGTYTTSDEQISRKTIYDISKTEFKTIEGESGSRLVLSDGAKISDPFASSSKIEIGKLYYYDTQKENGIVKGYTPVKDSNNQDAWFYIKDIYEIKQIELSTDRTTSDNTFGRFNIISTSGSSLLDQKIPFLEDLTIDVQEDPNAENPGDNNKFYYLKAKYAGEQTPQTIGPVAPTEWGVWANKLTKDNEGNITPEGATPKPNQDIDISFDRSQGNLGIVEPPITYEPVVWTESPSGVSPVDKHWYELQDEEYVLSEDTEMVSGKTYYERNREGAVEFYYWDLTKINDGSGNFSWEGEWTPIGTMELNLDTYNNFSAPPFRTDVMGANNQVKVTYKSITGQEDYSVSQDTPWK